MSNITDVMILVLRVNVRRQDVIYLMAESRSFPVSVVGTHFISGKLFHEWRYIAPIFMKQALTGCQPHEAPVSVHVLQTASSNTRYNPWRQQRHDRPCWFAR